MKSIKVQSVLVLLSLFFLHQRALPVNQPVLENSVFKIQIVNQNKVLWQYSLKEPSFTQTIAPPVFEIEGKDVVGLWQKPLNISSKMLYGDVKEIVISGAVRSKSDLSLELHLQFSADNPVVRFQYILSSVQPNHLTKAAGRDQFDYFSSEFSQYHQVHQVRLTEYDELVHCYLPAQRTVDERYFENEKSVDGPILIGENDSFAILLAYEHGCQLPDSYLTFNLNKDRRVTLKAVKGNYWSGEIIDSQNDYETVWMDIAGARTIKHLSDAFRSFILNGMSPNLASRKPFIYYNTWNYQERNWAWNKQPYLESMNLDRIMKEIDIAHRMGIDVFVLDTGWYQKTGDWEVSIERFPDTLRTVKAKLDQYGMKLGLWFNNTAAVSSRILAANPDCKISWDGKPSGPNAVWETEDSYPMCLVSDYWDDYADELIRLSRELGVTYFKWDAIGQYGCNDPNHYHGDAGVSSGERADSYAFLLSRYMKKIVNRLCQANPEAIVDFDVTEGERAVGLEFLSAGKYFLVNNGPYYVSFDDSLFAPGGGMGANVFVFPGPARARVCRSPLIFDQWIPSILFLTHYLPDDPLVSQTLNIGSLILGQNGIWGDLLSLSEQGIETFHKLLSLYKQVREDITNASPVLNGRIGGVPEIHEKVNPRNGKGVVVLFFNYKNPWIKLQEAKFGGTFEYITEHKVDPSFWHSEGVQVSIDKQGRACIKADFKGPEAKIIFFGVKE